MKSFLKKHHNVFRFDGLCSPSISLDSWNDLFTRCIADKTKGWSTAFQVRAVSTCKFCLWQVQLLPFACDSELPACLPRSAWYQHHLGLSPHSLGRDHVAAQPYKGESSGMDTICLCHGKSPTTWPDAPGYFRTSKWVVSVPLQCTSALQFAVVAMHDACSEAVNVLENTRLPMNAILRMIWKH